jgi:hypothetical protein
MQRTVVALLLIVNSSFISIPLFSQSALKLPTVSPLPGDVKMLVVDYPNRFANVIGDEIAKNPQATDYNCSLKISGAEKSVITHYSSASNNSCGWEGEMLVTENFEEAKQKYKALYNQLNNLSIAEAGFNFKGKYDEPAEEKKFAGTVLSPDKTINGFTKLRLEISLQYELLEWKVKVLLYDREREDNERGKATE